MKYFYSAAVLLAATVSADLCSEGSTDDDGNYYCQEVTAVTYVGVGGSGTYDKVTDMPSSGDCSSESYSYSGSMAPLDEEVSMHFRGPLELKQFAVYTPSSSSSKKARRSAHERRHAHALAHAHGHHAHQVEKREEITATIDGKVVSWATDFTTSSSTAEAATSTLTVVNKAVAASSSSSAAASWSSSTSSAAASSSSSTSSAAASSSSSSSTSDSTSSWSRVAYYDSASGTQTGLTLLNHYGGTGSGVFDDTYGNSLSYATADGLSGSSSAQVLDATTIPSAYEILFMSDTICDDDCGYVRPGTVAYHGFDGAQKLFFFEFEMPNDGDTATDTNMPAIWMLNAQIPNTLQYGSSDCSCWTSGCGEFDIFEVLAVGDTRAKSTLHGNIAGGDSDYFARPESGTIKVAVILYDDEIHITILDDDTDLGSSIDAATILTYIDDTTTQSSSVSVFTLS